MKDNSKTLDTQLAEVQENFNKLEQQRQAIVAELLRLQGEFRLITRQLEDLKKEEIKK